MVRFSEMSRGNFAKWLLFGVVFLVGALTLAQQVGSMASDFAKTLVTNQKTYDNHGSGSVGPDRPEDLSKAKFAYLLPGKSADWKLADGQSAYEAGKGIVKYQVMFTNAKVNASISQQVFPGQLKPRDGDKFMKFVDGTKPTRSADVNRGTVYFLPALQNGAPANGTDTVIFARDDVLMFGQSQGILGWDAWTKFVSSMQPNK